MKITIKQKDIVRRNYHAQAVLDPKGPFRARSERDRSKYTRKQKHRKGDAE
jgi:hypothetical protein